MEHITAERTAAQQLEARCQMVAAAATRVASSATEMSPTWSQRVLTLHDELLKCDPNRPEVVLQALITLGMWSEEAPPNVDIAELSALIDAAVYLARTATDATGARSPSTPQQGDVEAARDEEIISSLKSQHDVLVKMLKNVASAGETQRKAAMGSLERFLTAHEAAEEAYLDQAIKNLDHMQVWVEKLTELDYKSPEFLKQFTQFQKELLNHAQTEISHTIPKALKDMTQAQMDLVQAAFERGSQIAETAEESSSSAPVRTDAQAKVRPPRQ